MIDHRKCTAAGILATLVVAASACSTGTPATPDSAASNTVAASDGPAQRLLESSADATSKITSAHLVIDLVGSFDRLGQVTKVEGDAQIDPLIINGANTYQNGEVNPFVIANDTVSVHVGGSWNIVGATSAMVPPALVDVHQGIPKVLESVESPRLAGQERIDGIDTDKVTGTIGPDQVQELLPGTSGSADFTAWIRHGGDPVIVRTSLAPQPDRTVTVTLSRWNSPVKVTEAPAS